MDPKLTEAAYHATSGGPLSTPSFYFDKLPHLERKREFSLIVPIRSGRAWYVKAGQICRLSLPDGPQVGDLNLWHAHNPRERMWASRTRQLQAAHVSLGDRLWSCLPYLRPMCTIIGDSLADYGKDSNGGRVHDLLGTRCDPYVNRMITGKDFDYHCHSNLTRAITPHGLNESDVHDVLNVFQLTGLNDQDKYWMGACPAKKGDYFEFIADIDLLCALSTCPGGDLSVRMWDDSNSSKHAEDAQLSEGEDDPTLKVCRPIQVDVFSCSEGALQSLGWSEAECNGPQKYKGLHGMKPKEYST
ncbi:hypothetical protein CONPUDRAFT_132163 [Coniophora puteana RWD-64-598 SS2]|uniref:DUF1989 domain-containing protein n=1 Tax=Coniophora puteana (strain RWD-64-598) TaxID=741705 RepID=A0A5M3M8G5_CONPW|nr:uncharacterized protein CONPUDRAFT_132163 [Coniophora puteana RWD-64-598 SS2]EIW75226.1 hypothetical protein CONPUDRAFT_132163 [Coniophora puteana RWD-64-598 SS2]